MKGKLIALFTVVCLVLMGSVKAQLLVGPTLSGGMTYGKNFVVDDTSRFYMENSASTYFGGGLDVLYQFDENIRVHAGIQYAQRKFLLAPPSPVEGLQFTEVERMSNIVSIPMTVHYRIPMGESGSNYINFIAGHSIDITSEDSVVIKRPFEAIDSIGASWTRYEYQNIKRTLPTVLLGAGLDLERPSGNIINLSLIWGIGTGEITRGNVSEWQTLNGAFDPTDQELPDEFPDHYYDWSLRGSTLSLKASYWFNLDKLFNKDEDEESGDESLIEDAD